jgi:hypothetical protein
MRDMFRVRVKGRFRVGVRIMFRVRAIVSLGY